MALALDELETAASRPKLGLHQGALTWSILEHLETFWNKTLGMHREVL